MNGLNRVLLIGNLTRDPVSRATTGGMSICEIGLAINRRYRTASGEDREETCFVDIDVFGKQAEQCSRYLRKGSLAFVEGRLRLDQWDDRATGQKRSRLKVMAERVQFLDSRSRDDSGGGRAEAGSGGMAAARPLPPAGAGRPARQAPSGPPPAQAEPEVFEHPESDEGAVDDIPF
ncbi:MAG: single-stranded DNA-binding protein [Lentisphaerae bacterium]|nr:single-stranded DNA-binding protein [Lentisphaerota bacterium]